MARSFNGTSDNITKSSGFTFVSSGTPGTNFSVSQWALAASTSAGVHQISMFGAAGAYGFQFRRDGSTWNMYTKNNSNADINSTDAGGVVANVWTHIAGIYNGSVIALYVNGVQKNVPAIFGLATTTDRFMFGSDTAVGGPGSYWDGRIADVCVWTGSILTIPEIIALANGARPFNIRPAQIVGYWPLDGAQSPEPDLSGNANNGTLTGTALAAGPPVMMFTARWPQFSEPPLFYTIRKQVRLNILQTGP